MKKTTIFLLLIGITNLTGNLYSQNTNSAQEVEYNNLNRYLNRSDDGILRTFNRGYEGVKGTPFLYDDWKIGKVYISGHQDLPNIKIKFDLYNNELIFLNPANNESYIADKYSIQKFVIDGDNGTEVYSKFFMKKAAGIPAAMNYAQLLFDGETKFLKFRWKTMLKADNSEAYGSNRHYDEFIYDEFYYLLKPAGEQIKVRLNKNSIIKAFPNKKSEIKSFLNENNLAIDKEEDIVKVLEYLESK